MEKMLRRLIGEDIELIVVRPVRPALVKADPGQIEQVLMNLAVNARDAMPKGGRLTVEVADLDVDAPLSSMEETVPPGRYVVASVSDTGTGMDSETLVHIFEPFFTTKEKGKGTGLGLSTVFGIVKQSGGFVLVASAPGQGTTFRIFFPRVDGEGAAVAPKGRAETSLRGSEVILVVEDEEQIRALVRASLGAQGYTVLDAASAEEALRVSARHVGSLDLLLTDVVLKGESGRELADRLLAQRPGVKLLYISGYTDDVISHHGVLEPGIVFLQKPFTPAALARKVREALEIRPPDEDPLGQPASGPA
jgi:CheY-like chemotaxis protein